MGGSFGRRRGAIHGAPRGGIAPALQGGVVGWVDRAVYIPHGARPGARPPVLRDDLAPRLGALAGVVISASHNPAEFNGVKFFRPDGRKVCAAFERAVEKGVVSAEDPGPGAVAVHALDGGVDD